MELNEFSWDRRSPEQLCRDFKLKKLGSLHLLLGSHPSQQQTNDAPCSVRGLNVHTHTLQLHTIKIHQQLLELVVHFRMRFFPFKKSPAPGEIRTEQSSAGAEKQSQSISSYSTNARPQNCLQETAGARLLQQYYPHRYSQPSVEGQSSLSVCLTYHPAKPSL